MPYFTKDLKKAQRPVNARSETVATSGMFRAALSKRRCLVPADAFYEWKALADGKQPYAITRTDGAPLPFAGLWESWRSPENEILRTFTVLTTAANVDMVNLHNRMPVIVEEADWRTWLGEVPRDPLELLRPAKEGVVRFWPVSRAVNNVRNNGPDLLERMDDPAAPPKVHLPETIRLDDCARSWKATRLAGVSRMKSSAGVPELWIPPIRWTQLQAACTNRG